MTWTTLRRTAGLALLLGLCAGSGGCILLLAGGAGAEGGYVASQKERKAGDTVSDQWIHTKITTSLVSHSKVKARNIDVQVFKGVVTLSGTIGSSEERETAVNLAKSVDGVKNVVDRLSLGKR